MIVVGRLVVLASAVAIVSGPQFRYAYRGFASMEDAQVAKVTAMGMSTRVARRVCRLCAIVRPTRPIAGMRSMGVNFVING